MNSNLELRKIEPGTAEHGRAMAMAHARGEDIDGRDKQTWPPARSVRYWVNHWGGYSTSLKAPDGSEHQVSLEPWRDEDPDTTFIAIRIKLRDDWSPPESMRR